MNQPATITYDGSNTIAVEPGRALRLNSAPYPLFRAPEPASVSDPDVCLDFLKSLHLSLCPVFDIRLRRWMGRYFDALPVQADRHAESLLPVAGLDPATAHRAWCYTAYRPLSNARFEWNGAMQEIPVLLWRDSGPLAICFEGAPEIDALDSVVCDHASLGVPPEDFLAGLGGDVAHYWQDVAAPRHPFVRSALSGLRG